MREDIVIEFNHGLREEKNSGKTFRFSVAQEEEFVRAMDSYIEDNCVLFSQALKFEGKVVCNTLWEKGIEERIERALECSIFPHYQEIEPMQSCLILLAEIRPMMISLLNIHHYNYFVMVMVITQRYSKLYGLGDLMRAGGKYIHRRELLPKLLARVCHLGIDNEEVCRWILENWIYCKPYRKEILKRISHKSGGDQNTYEVFYNFISKRRFLW